MTRFPPWQKPPRGTLIDPSHPLARGLVFAAPLNELGGTSVRDMVHGTVGSFSSSPSPEWCPDGLRFEYAGSPAEYVDFGNLKRMDFTGDFTVAARVVPMDSSTNYQGICNKCSTAAGNGWQLLRRYESYPRFWFRAYDISGVRADANWTLGQTYDVVGMVKAGTAYIYQDAIVQAQQNSGSLDEGDTQSFQIGTYSSVTGGTGAGDTHYVYIWNRALSQEEISLLHREPYCFFQRQRIFLEEYQDETTKYRVKRWPGWQKPVRGTQLNKSHPLAKNLKLALLMNEQGGGEVFDHSGQGDAFTLTGSGIAWDRGGLYIDGTDGNGISLGATDWQITGPHTLWTFVRPGFAYDTSGYPRLFQLNTNALLLFFSASPDDYRYSLVTSGGTTEITFALNSSFEDQDVKLWAKYDGSMMYAGKDDGSYQISAAKTGTITPTSENYLLCSDLISVTYSWEGHVYAMYIWDRALTAEEIALLHREPYCMFENVRLFRTDITPPAEEEEEGLQISPTGIASISAFGTPTLQPGSVSISASGIESLEAFGSPSVNLAAEEQFVNPTGIASAEGHGSPTLQPGPVSVQPTGIASIEGYGSPSLSPGGVSLSPTGVASVEAFGSATLSQPGGAAYRVVRYPPWQKPIRGMRLNKSHPLSRELVACWIFNEGTGLYVQDYSGYGQHLTIDPSFASWAVGPKGIGLTFHDIASAANLAAYRTGSVGVNPGIDHLMVTHEISLDIIFTTPSSVVGWNCLLEADGSTTGRELMGTYVDGNEKYTGMVARSDEYYDAGPGDTILAGNNTYHGAFTWTLDWEHKWIYLNGLHDHYTYDPGPDSQFDEPCQYLSVGMSPQWNEASNGYIVYAIRIWGRALTDAEIAWLYREPYAMFENVRRFGVTGGAGQYIEPTGVATAEDHGSPILQPGPVSVQPTGIASIEALGTDSRLWYYPAITWGEQSPNPPEQPVQWSGWSNGAGGSPRLHDNGWGQLVLFQGEVAHSPIQYMGPDPSYDVTVSLNEYGSTHSGSFTVYVRGSSTFFSQDAESPFWEEYTAPVSRSWNYVQVKLVGV